MAGRGERNPPHLLDLVDQNLLEKAGSCFLAEAAEDPCGDLPLIRVGGP